METFRTSSLGESLSSDPERTAPRGRGGVWLYRSLQQRTGSLNIKSIFVNENQISQIKGLSTFLYMERCKSLGSLKLLCASALWGQCFVRSHPESLQGASLEWGFSGWWLDGRHPGSSLNSLRAHIRGGCNVMAWWLQYPLFTDLAGNIFYSKWLWNRLSLVVRGSSGHTYAHES